MFLFRRSQFQADPSDLLGINLNGGEDNSSRDSSTTGGDRDPGDPESRLKRKSGRFGDNGNGGDFDVRSAKMMRYLDNDEMEMRRRVSRESPEFDSRHC